VNETTNAIFGKDTISGMLGKENSLSVDLDKKDKPTDVRMRTYKYLSDYFWQNVQA
jgi:hypothetical protein